MNLIGHYTCAADQPPVVRVGAVLPDLAALYRRKVRPLPLARDWAAQPQRPEGMDALLAGVAFHHAVDMRFHRAPLFQRTADALQGALLGASSTAGLKRFLPAHVLCELYLDHLMLRRNAGLADAFYRDLAEAEPLMTEFIDRHPLADAPSFRGFLDHIVDGRFVDAYETYEGILDRMGRILVRFGQRPLESAEERAVTRHFQAAERETERALDAFLLDMRELAMETAAGYPAEAGPALDGGLAARPG